MDQFHRSALVMCRADPNGCPRPRQVAGILGEKFRVSVLASAPLRQPGVDSVVLPELPLHGLGRVGRISRLAARRYHKLLWNDAVDGVRDSLAGEGFDLVVSHDVELLPLAAEIARSGRLVFDAREYYPRHFEDRVTWRWLYGPLNHDLCRRYLSRCDAVLTVSDGIAREYERVYGVVPEVVPSLPPFFDLEPSPVAPDNIRLVHHGWANRSRRIESMIRMMDFLDHRFTLDLMLVPLEARYDRYLKDEAGRRPNVSIVPPVRYDELVTTTNRYDVGVFLCPPTTFNLLHALPNKLFEFIQARLAVAIGPSPEMRKVVEDAGCGVVAADFEPQTLAAMLGDLSTEAVVRMKHQAHAAAARLHSGTTRERLLALCDRLMEPGEPGAATAAAVES